MDLQWSTVGGGEEQAVVGGIDAGVGNAESVGDELAALYEKHRALVCRFARRFVDDATAEDVTQEVFLRLLIYKSGALRGLSPSFLLTTTRNVAVRALSRRSREQEWNDEAPEPACPRSGRESHADRECVTRLLSRLPGRQHDAVVLTDRLGLTERQAALCLGSSRSAIAARRRTALDRLRREVVRRIGALFARAG
jgi:RNA polymerase sigma factor (sigma-70 family)